MDEKKLTNPVCILMIQLRITYQCAKYQQHLTCILPRKLWTQNLFHIMDREKNGTKKTNLVCNPKLIKYMYHLPIFNNFGAIYYAKSWREKQGVESSGFLPLQSTEKFLA